MSPNGAIAQGATDAPPEPSPPETAVTASFDVGFGVASQPIMYFAESPIRIAIPLSKVIESQELAWPI